MTHPTPQRPTSLRLNRRQALLGAGLGAAGALGSGAVVPARAATPGTWNTAAGRYPDTTWKPFPQSPFWRRVPANPVVEPTGWQQMRAVRALGKDGRCLNNMDFDPPRGGDWGHSIWFAGRSDPWTRIAAPRLYRAASMEAPHDWTHLPAGAQAPAGSDPYLDGHLTIVDELDYNGTFEFWKYGGVSGGSIQFGSGARYWLGGNGITSADQPDYGTSTAAGFSCCLGLVRGVELAAGVINHALFMVIKQGAPGFVPPAIKGDQTGSSDLPKMGAHIWLSLPTWQIRSLPIAAWQKTILVALHEYGGFFGDTGGAGWGLQVESPLPWTAYGRTAATTAYAARHTGEWIDEWQGMHVGHWENVPDWVWDAFTVLVPGQGV